MLSRQKEIGIRIPDSTLCEMLVGELDHPILNTTVTTPEDDQVFYPEVDANDVYTDAAEMMLDAGSYYETILSTVARIRDNEVEILREGKGDINKLFI